MSLQQKYDLTGRVALISGASSRGIGYGSARALAEQGAKVFLVARREEMLAEKAALIKEAGGSASYLACDVSDESQVETAIATCVEEFGRLDIMVLSAGIAGMFSEDVEGYMDTDDWREVLGTNLDGVYHMIQHGWQECAKGGVGSIIPILSMAALKVSGGLAYTATKGALLRMVPWLAKNLGPEGVRVNGIAPGLVDTDMTNPPGWDTTEMILAPGAAKAPLRRLATIEDCADLALFLASDVSRAITGQVIAVDGGEAMIE